MVRRLIHRAQSRQMRIVFAAGEDPQVLRAAQTISDEKIGPVLMGIDAPMHILQRGSAVEDIVNIAAIGAVQAQSEGS